MENELLDERVCTQDARIKHLYEQVQELGQTLHKLKAEKQVAVKEKEEELRRVKADFETQKTKMQENLQQKNRVYKPIQS